jgi:elongation factor P
MIDTSDMKNGTIFEYDNNVWQVVWFQHHKPGKGGAMLRVKLRNMRAGSIIERTFKSGEKFREVNLTRKKKQYLYTAGDKYAFMDMETYEQIEISKEQLGGAELFLMENMEVEALYLDGEFLSIQMPASVQLKVTETVPGIKGNSATNVTKPAKLETGVEVSVPMFVNEGDLIKVDTRTREYIERA